jgi:DNA-directed RNA polymerase III subunit RPC3
MLTSSDPTSVADIVANLPTSDDLAAGLHTGSARPSIMTLTKEYLGLLAAADNPTPAGRAAAFVSFGGSKAQAMFDELTRRLRHTVLERFARERYGDGGLRVLRLLLARGKMDERTVGKTALMAAKDVRPLLGAMSADGVISMQEVPKSADRNPSRMFYLWYVSLDSAAAQIRLCSSDRYVDLKKTYSVVLGRLYKTQYNIAARRRAEGEDALVRAVLDKRARSDVEQDEGLLARNEREVLAEYDARCERLTIIEMRVNEAVCVLRDLRAGGGEE